jgi:hypothetical protein
VTRGAIDPALDVNPVGKDDKFRKFIHSAPGNPSLRLDIFDHFQCLGPFTDCIAGMTDPTEFDVWNPCSAIFVDISMAKVAVQLGDFLMENMIEADRLFNGFTS